MLKNLRRKAPEKDKLGHDLFKFTKTGEHGFQHKPSAVAYDSKLHLLAIGTRNGTLKVFGQPGVELVAQESSAALSSIQQLFFLEEQGRIISVCDDGEQNSLHLWEINNPYGEKSILEEVKACTLEGRLKKISVCCLSMARECLYIGTEGGHIYILDLNTFELKDHVIYQDIIMQSLSGDVNKNGGSVEALQEHPLDPEKLLIGYKKGIIVLWNQDKIKAEGTFIASQDVESLSWNPNCKQFISSHEHGSISVWNIPENNGEDIVPETSTPFGPFPCKAIRKVEWHDPTIIFSGGLPRASYGDKHCVSILQGSTVQVVLDFTSKVIDFFTIRDSSSSSVNPDALVVLCEEEIVVIDLMSSDISFPVYNKPYLSCLHSSHISSSAHINDCPDDLLKHLIHAGKQQAGTGTTLREWPVTGGKSLLPETIHRNLIITGHEDGTVKFWDASSLSFTLLYTIHTARLFQSDFDNGPPPDDGEDEDWPPFKKVGNFDPYADDTRFVIQKLLLCPVSKTLLVGGSGGQLIIYDLKPETELPEKPEMVDINVIENLDGFEWKGLGPLSLSTLEYDKTYGPVPKKVLQLKPSAPITAVAMESAWGLIASGTCHGLIVYDILSNKVSLKKCTVNPTDLANTGAGIQRKRTLAKSLRDSFRRLRSKRGSRRKQKVDGAASPNTPVRSVPTYEAAPQTRLIDENRVDEDVLSMVRCLYFGETFLGDATHPMPTLWAGTNAGYIYVYAVQVPDKANRNDNTIKAEVGKELKLKHHAPVVNIFVVDKHGVPIGSVAEARAGRTSQADMTGGHCVVISSEEQFKVFSLPALRPKNKEKLTAVDGSRVRKLGIVEINAKQDDHDVKHYCLVCLTNQGDVIAYSIPNLKSQIKINVIKREDIRAISSLVFSRYGEGFFLKSPSELQRFCVVASEVISSDTIIKLPSGMRPDEENESEEDTRTNTQPNSPNSAISSNSNHFVIGGPKQVDSEPVTGISYKSTEPENNTLTEGTGS